MRRALGAAIIVIVMLVGAPLGATPKDDAGEHKVTICHATSSAKNPWVVITVDVAAWEKRGHGEHVHKNGLDYVVAEGTSADACGSVG